MIPFVVQVQLSESFSMMAAVYLNVLPGECTTIRGIRTVLLERTLACSVAKPLLY